MRFLPWAAAILSAVCVQANEWHAYYRLTSDAYQAKFNDLVGQGYRLNSVSGYERNGQPNFAVIFEKKSSKFNEYLSQGYRVVQVNGYTVGENAYYAAIWDKSPSAGWVTRHGMTVESMQNLRLSPSFYH
ncbi:hypothetical protein CDV55_100832 [Aspergillus turcosus]|uniref:Uncharacterized protein n=1 Tax=Aspergillus turcosus TaxID=1245748 RepID=A0A229WXQ9_9EURO|nr:hypothetical protein CDV55_100832 [Aspergillus turcosus]RLL93749.1 hypothetical protein CFD26_100929 [Aspergillus turcosus]